MKKYDLTIIIPHYNSSVLLEKLLSTIPNYNNIEVIVVDDKSREEHIEYIQRIKQSGKYIDFILLSNTTPEKGAGTARNIGLERATGDWVMFADSDDYFADSFFENVSKYFGSHNDIVFFRSTSLYIDTGEMADRHLDIQKVLDNYVNDKSKKNELYLRYDIFPPWAKLIKKAFLDKNGINFDELIVSNDVMFSTKVGFFMKNFDISDKIIYIITRNHGSLTTNMSEEVFDIRFENIINYHNYLKQRLPIDQFEQLNLPQFGRAYIVKSFKYGILKTLKVISELNKNNFKFFHAKLLNPLHLASKTIHYKNKNKKEINYMTNEKIEVEDD